MSREPFFLQKFNKLEKNFDADEKELRQELVIVRDELGTLRRELGEMKVLMRNEVSNPHHFTLSN